MIIDTHGHLGYWPQFHCPDVSLETLLRVMDSLDVERMICSHHALLRGDLEFGLQESIQTYEKSSGRILLYTVFHPGMKQSMSFVQACLKREGFVGIKIHPSLHRCYADDERYRPIWEFAAGENVPILTHCWDISDHNPAQACSFPTRFKKFIAAYPDATVILGHAGGRYDGHLAAAQLAKQHENVYLDLAGDCYSLGLIEYLVGQAGAEKILFGSDITWIDPRTHIGRVLDADVSTQDKERILRSNALRVFSLRGDG